MRLFRIASVLLSLFFIQLASAQEDSTNIELNIMLVIKQDGGKYTGPILADDGREILLDSKEVGKIYIPKHLIKSIQPFDQNATTVETSEIKEKEQPTEFEKPKEFERLYSTKYLQTDNAYPLRPGEAFIKFAPVGLEAQIPINNRWSVGALTSYVGLPFAIKSKVSFDLGSDNYLSLDMIYGSMVFGGLFGTRASEGGGAAAATFTFGDRTTNFTVRGGYAFLHENRNFVTWDPLTGELIENPDEMRFYNFGYAGFAGMVKVADRADFIFDILTAVGNNGFYAAAGAAARFGPRPNHRFQLGLEIFTTSDFFIPVPIPAISYTYIFSKRTPEKNF